MKQGMLTYEKPNALYTDNYILQTLYNGTVLPARYEHP